MLSFRVVLLSLVLTFLSVNLPSCDAYTYAILSKTLPQRSYYIETSVTSSQLSSAASGLNIQTNLQAVVNSTSHSDVTLNAQGTGLFAIVSMDQTSWRSYCVIRVLGADSSTIEQSGLSCTIAANVLSARVQAEPSDVTCGGLNPCKQSIVAALDIDTANNNIQQTQATDNMGASSNIIIIGAVSGAVGAVLLVVVVAMVIHSRRQPAYTNLKQTTKPASTTTSVMWATPPAVMSASTAPNSRLRGPSNHVRTQTEQNYAVNPIRYNIAVDIHEPGFQ